MGRLVRDPEIRYSQSDPTMVIAKFSLAVDRRYKRDNEPSADFINCVAFGRPAEVVEKYCIKGTKLVVDGWWKTGSYTNKDGNKVHTNDCMVIQLEFAESKKTAEENNTARPQPMTDNDGFMNIPDGIDEELPFN